MSTSSRDSNFSVASRGSRASPTVLDMDIPHHLPFATARRTLATTTHQRATPIERLTPWDHGVGAPAFDESIMYSIMQHSSRANFTAKLASMKEASLKLSAPSYNPFTGERTYQTPAQPMEGEQARPIPCYVFCRGHRKTQTGDWNWRGWKEKQIARKNGLERTFSGDSGDSSDSNVSASWSTIVSDAASEGDAAGGAESELESESELAFTKPKSKQKAIRYKRVKVRGMSTISLLTRQIRKANGQEALEREAAEPAAEWAGKMGLESGDAELLPSAFESDSEDEDGEEDANDM